MFMILVSTYVPAAELAWDSDSSKIRNAMEGGSLAVIFSSVLLLAFVAASSFAAPDEAAALLSFKRSSVEADPRNSLRSWGSDDGGSPSGPCLWAGVICSVASGRVWGLNLSNMGLGGRLGMGDLMSLQSLRNVDLSGNSFYGNLSHAAASSSLATAPPCAFETVDLSGNNFTNGVAGGFLGPCNRLLSLNLSGNSISRGVYPFPLSLQRLDLSRNRLSDEGLLGYALSGGCGSLAYLNMSANKLAGKLGVVSAACGRLTVLDLSHNNLSGEIPHEFMAGLPPSLKQLDLSYNNFSGHFSRVQFGPCGNLTQLNLSHNALSGGGLPANLVSCGQLERLDLSHNKQIEGEIPSFWESFVNLKYLSLSNNRFSGNIPPELARTCSTLTSLDLSGNKLTGGMPAAFVSCAALQSLDLGSNQLSGDFVETVVGTLPNLRFLRLAFNNISGPVPMASLSNCSMLEVVDLGSNELSGEIPVGFCSSLPSLQKLLLPNNLLSGMVPPELGECTNLRALDLSFNGLGGPIPLQVWTLRKLVDLAMWANNLSGEIPDEICSHGASFLETLIINHNAMTGSIPASLARCTNLIWVSLSGNRLVGSIPPRIGELRNLAILQLGNNSLSGEIPQSLGECRNLIWLDLSLNGLTGPIPPSLASQSGIIVPGVVSGREYAFLRNGWGASCPGAGAIFEIAGIRRERLLGFALIHGCPATRFYWGMTVYTFPGNGSIIYLDLSYNGLTGPIPESFGAMTYMQIMSLGHNQLTGPIPESIGDLKAVAVLDLSHNRLSGAIPGALGKLSLLVEFDVSNNNLTGAIPSTGQLTTFPPSRYQNNSGLCGVPLPPCGPATGRSGSGLEPGGQGRRFLGGSVLIVVAVSVLALMSLLLTLYKLRRNGKAGEKRGSYVQSLPPTSRATSWKLSGAREPLSINIAAFEKPLRKLTFTHLLEATDGFGDASRIGSGGFGEVYRAQLRDGCVVAVKKLVHVAGQGDREFTAEMETIGKIKHRNLVPLLGYCKAGEERILVYEYMKHGSLDVALHYRTKESPKLDWPARKKIAAGAARGLAFLHHSCIPHIIHRDMKSSNVLLDENLDARVSDFGMARLVSALDTHLSVTTLAGTPGYVPPEYYHSFWCTAKGDVYSYGVVLLELLSGKKPIDPTEFGDSNLVGWAKQMVRERRGAEVFDPELMVGNCGEEELHRYLKVACQCLDDRPLRRPTMIQVMAMFKELQAGGDSDVLDGLSLGNSDVLNESTEKTR